MKTTVSACILASMLTATMMALPQAQPSQAKPQAQPSATPSATDKVVINGWALSMGTVATGKNQSIRININKWSNPQQRAHLIQTFLDKKQDGLLRELEKQPEMGRFNFPGYMGPDPNSVFRLGTDIRYAMSF